MEAEGCFWLAVESQEGLVTLGRAMCHPVKVSLGRSPEEKSGRWGASSEGGGESFHIPRAAYPASRNEVLGACLPWVLFFKFLATPCGMQDLSSP